MRRLALLCLVAGCSFPGMGNHNGDDDDDGGAIDGGGGDDDGGDDAPPDACPCPDAGGGGNIDSGGGGGGCSGASSAAGQPFANHAFDYAAGSILPSNHSQAQLDDQVRGFYDSWKQHHLRQGCGTGRYYIDIGINDRMTVSEAHGFGMVVIAYMAGHDPDAKEIFDGMFHYFQDHPSSGTANLMAWAQGDNCQDVDGSDSASDGDLDIAYALLLADKQWSSGGAINYKQEAEKVIDAIRAGETDSGGNYILLGDWTGGSGNYYDATRSSDFMPGHLKSYAAATGDNVWINVADETYGVVNAVRNGTTGLIPDFVVHPLSNPAPAPSGFLEGPRDGQYGYNACRDPWRIGVDFLTHGDSRSKAIIEDLSAWIRDETNGDPGAIQSSYALNGNGLGADYYDTAFAAPFGVAAMVDSSNQQWLDSVWDSVIANSDNGYYGDTIAMLSLIAMSGNWWTPEAAPCP